MPFVQWLKQNNKKGIIGQFGVPDTDSRWITIMDKFLQYLKAENVTAQYSSSGKRLSGNPVSTYPLASVERPQIKTLQTFLAGAEMTYKKPIEKTESLVQAEPNANNNVTAEKVVEAPAEPPSSFLFLPGTLLLPQPNGGLYKPVLKSTTTREKSVRVAKYRRP